MTTDILDADAADNFIALGVASVDTKGAGLVPQPDSNQPMRQVIGIQED